MISPRLRRRHLPGGAVESVLRLSSAAARLVSLTPTHVPGPAGSPGKIAVRCDRPWTAGGNAGARSRRSSRLQPRRNPFRNGTIVTVHTGKLLSFAAALTASGQTGRARRGREWPGEHR
jgi:hypothetical protein